MPSGHGGTREGAGRKARLDPALLTGEQRDGKPGPLSQAERECYARILDALDRPGPKDPEKEPLKIRRWRILVDAILDMRADTAAKRLAFDALRYLHDHRDGKAVQPVDVEASVNGAVNIFAGDIGELRNERRRRRLNQRSA